MSYIVPPGVHATLSDSTIQAAASASVEYGMTLDTNDDLSGFTHDIVGSTVTISNASPAVVSWSGHTMYAGSCVQFSTDGALPEPLVAGTRYYVISAGLSAGVSFQIATAPGGAAINTTTAGSGTHKARSTSRIYVPQSGNYIMAVSSVLDTSNNAACLMDLYLKKNGTNVAGTNTQIGFSAANIQQVVAVTISIELAKNDYLELYYHCSSTTARFLSVAAQAGPPAVPACPSTIVCIWKSSR